MSDTSVIAAALTRYDSIKSGFGSPPIFFDEAPVKNSGSDLRPPYVVLKDGGLVPSFEFEFQALETSSLVFEVHAEQLTTVDAIVEGIKYGGGAITAGSGFDFGSLPSLATGHRSVRIIRTKETRFLEGLSYTSLLLHRCRLEYTVVLQRSS